LFDIGKEALSTGEQYAKYMENYTYMCI